MYSRDYRDIIGGGLLVALGLWAGFHAIVHFDLGTPGRMGPGMFPAALRILLAGLGAIIALPAFFRTGTLPTVDWRPTIFVSLAVILFAMSVTRLGMIPAVVLLTLAAVAADIKIGWRGAIVLSIGLSVLAYLIFRIGLGIVLEPFRWPF